VTPDLIAARLSQRPGTRQPARGRAAAVLLPLFERDGATRIVFIKRTETMRTHKGQYAFPGGGRDPGDPSIEFTALREAREEIGLDPDGVRVLGTLDDLVTISGFVVTPVVGWIESLPTLTPNPREVQYVVDLPLASFLEPPRARTLLWEGIRRIVLAFDVEGHFIWGVTASILRAFVAALDATA
jgi:8-oxo-dGTP pyrophosphatase MutT (NUDIX family)